MLGKIGAYLTQPAKSSFRTENLSPGHPIATIVPKEEPLWKSVLLDMRDGPLIVLTEAVSSIRDSIKNRTAKTLSR